MENTMFDIFSSVKNLLYIGNYHDSLTENESTDINEEDPVLVIRKKFYMFLAYLEEDRQNDLNNLLMELKDAKDSTKIYYNIFRVYLVYFMKGSYKEEFLTKIYNDLVNLENVNMFLQPAVYLISLILLDLDDKERFLHLSKIMINDPEVILLRVFYFLRLNKIKEAKALVEYVNTNDSESLGTVLCNILLCLHDYQGEVDKALKFLAEIKQNYKITPKLFNIVAVALMYNGKYNDAVKPLNLGVEACLKSGTANYDLNVLLVNLICCYRNLGKPNELKETEEKLRSFNPENKYFAKLKYFDEEFEKAFNK